MNVLHVAGILFVGGILGQTDALICRRCDYAHTLDECKYSMTCPANNECYMERVINAQHQTVYRGGCRAAAMCKQSGKRATTCSHCCTTNNCNDKLCGITSQFQNANLTMCYHTEYTGVQSFTVEHCQSDQMCGIETYRLASQDTHESSCLNRRLCTLITQEALKRRAECDGSHDVTVCGLGKRQSGVKICTACCGDSYCNVGTCNQVVDRLYRARQFHVLDFKTLKLNGTLPATKG